MMTHINKSSNENKNALVAQKGAENNLLSFSQLTNKRYQVNWHHEVIAEKLEEALIKVERGEKARIILELPPRHGKSELASVLYPAWVLGKHPDYPVIVSSYSADLAEDFGRKSRDVMESSKYQGIFKTRLRPDTSAIGKWMTALWSGVVKRLLPAGGGYTATGIGGSITGKGGKIIIVDDPFKNREEADSEVYREKVWKFYTSTLYTRQEGAAAIVVICTRWHMDDLVGRLLKKQQDDIEAGVPENEIDRWDVVRFPAIAEDNELNRDKGEALWPEKFNIGMLEGIRNNVGVYEWSSLYQQSPINAEKAEFKQEYFVEFDEDEVRGKKDFDINILIDPAISEKKDACNTAIEAIGKVKSDPEWYILDYSVGKFDPGKLIEHSFEMYLEMRKQYPKANIKMWIETVAYQKALMYFFKEEMKKRQVYFVLNEFRDSGDKFQRIRGLVPLAKVGVIRIRKWMREFVKEALEFPKGKTVDLLDAASFNLQIVSPTKDKKSKGSGPDHVATSEYEGE